MKYVSIVVCMFLVVQTGVGQTDIKEVGTLISKAKLVFDDNFNREEKNNAIEDLGNGWKTNSINRAEGNKQADLRNNVLYVEMYKDATHGTSILHTAPFDDGIVRIKFKMLSLNKRGRAIEFNFNDPNAKHKTVNGHVCQVAVDTKGIKIEDQYTGRFNPILREKLKNGIDKEAVKKIMKEKSKKVGVDYQLNTWYEITIFFNKDVLSVYIDGKFIGKHQSKGFDVLKDNIALALWGTAGEFDDLKVWSLD